MIGWFSESFNDCCSCIHLAVCPWGELVKNTHLPALISQSSRWSKYRKGEPNTTKHVTGVSTCVLLLVQPIKTPYKYRFTHWAGRCIYIQTLKPVHAFRLQPGDHSAWAQRSEPFLRGVQKHKITTCQIAMCPFTVYCIKQISPSFCLKFGYLSARLFLFVLTLYRYTLNIITSDKHIYSF